MKEKIKEFLNREFVTQVKHICLAILFIIFTLVSFYFQNSAKNHAVCLTRVESRADLREILFKVVDLSDVFPESTEAQIYRLNRINFINEKFPELDYHNC